MRKYMKDAAPHILFRRPFKADSISGRYVKTNIFPDASYVVRSYSTPIALWYKGYWYITTEKFSQTTSTQQSALHLILKEADQDVLDVDADTFAEYWHEANN